jgi:TRAP-type C4-dicarboxylate transport system substrate-binding protein
MKTKLSLVGALAVAIFPLAAQADVKIKIATLAPKGSSWAKQLEGWGADVEKKTNGRVTFQWFETGEQGDERDVVRKMKLGQVDGSAITAVGLGLIKPDVRVLELPFLFRTDAELDYVRDKMSGEFAKQFDDAGYVLIAWGDVGWTHLFSNTELKSRKDLQNTKMWAWTDDPIVRAYFKQLGVNGVPLGVPDVQTALQTGTINACYGSPLAMVALKWYTSVKYGTDKPITYAIGALVIRKEVFNKLSSDDQKAMTEVGKGLDKALREQVRKDNGRAKIAMERSGVKFVPAPAEMMADFEKEAEAVAEALAGNVFGRDLLQRVRKFRDEARNKK